MGLVDRKFLGGNSGPVPTRGRALSCAPARGEGRARARGRPGLAGRRGAETTGAEPVGPGQLRPIRGADPAERRKERAAKARAEVPGEGRLSVQSGAGGGWGHVTEGAPGRSGGRGGAAWSSEGPTRFTPPHSSLRTVGRRQPDEPAPGTGSCSPARVGGCGGGNQAGREGGRRERKEVCRKPTRLLELSRVQRHQAQAVRTGYLVWESPKDASLRRGNWASPPGVREAVGSASSCRGEGGGVGGGRGGVGGRGLWGAGRGEGA